MTKEVPLTQGRVALVDNEDYERVMQYKWFTQKIGRVYYAVCDISGKRVYLHRFIINPKSNEGVDHIDNNGLNNQKFNLRIVTHAQNIRNCRKQRGSTSQYKGVTWHKNINKWIVTIHFNNKQTHLGYFSSEIDAAKAYDNKAKELFGEYAKLNFL